MPVSEIHLRKCKLLQNCKKKIKVCSDVHRPSLKFLHAYTHTLIVSGGASRGSCDVFYVSVCLKEKAAIRWKSRWYLYLYTGGGDWYLTL